jgi:heat shock protein HslJ
MWLACPLLLLLAACGSPSADSASPGAPSNPLRGTTFESGDVTVDGKPHELVAGTRVALDFTDDDRLVATAGCNTMSGPVDTGGGKLAVDGLATTEVGCDGPRQAQDEWLAGILGDGPTWRLDDQTLTVSTPDAELVLTNREVTNPDLSLAETEWAVDTILDGQTASSVPAGATATLLFGESQVVIAAGCNDGSADYEMTGDTIRFDRAKMTRKACEPDIMRLEAAVLAVTRDEVTFEIDADRLTVNHPSGKGLQLRAKSAR